jgi:2-keto-4-pentenoate hydratase/2-oxohepta-3-ene-1,7-dioic acid hydratase in catechol pathway
MRLLSFMNAGRESWGAVLPDGQVVDLTAATGRATLADFIASDAAYAERESIVRRGVNVGHVDTLTLLPVIPRPEKIVCIARNYLDHHKEVQAVGIKGDIHDEPPIFLRVWRSQCAHGAPMVSPRVSQTLDWEGELAVIIGKGGRDIPEERAYEHIAGYSCYNDGSVREWQFHAKAICAGKNFESTGAFGPWMVTADEIEPGRMLKIATRVNGEQVQGATTDMLIFGIPKLIAYASTIFTLSPGDVIATGTPAGVGLSHTPPIYMQAGDVCEVEIEAIGTLRNPIAAQT